MSPEVVPPFVRTKDSKSEHGLHGVCRPPCSRELEPLLRDVSMGTLDLPGPQGQTLVVGVDVSEGVLIPAEKAREPVRALGTLPSESLEPRDDLGDVATVDEAEDACNPLGALVDLDSADPALATRSSLCGSVRLCAAVLLSALARLCAHISTSTRSRLDGQEPSFVTFATRGCISSICWSISLMGDPNQQGVGE